jgi:UDP-N-acetylglucosamine--N-acetylmuramyl-(pentapeptide) pyrophosphoryl-undecaprenol N-acetylglucosamine transferase
MRIIITAGGGGHFAPALSVINTLPKEWDVLFIGRKYAFEADKTLSFEFKTAQEIGLPFQAISAGRLQRHWSRHAIPAFLRFPLGFLQAYRILSTYKPHLILSFGGYVSLPVVLAGALLRIPIVVHEQTLKVGLSNSIAAHVAKTICVSWEPSKQYFPKEKVVFTGNPLKLDKKEQKDFFKTHPIAPKDTSLPLLYITGGSLGSHAINELIADCIEKLLQKYVIVHQSGDAQEYKDFDSLLAKRNALPKHLQDRYIVTKFIDPYEVASLLQKATLVVSRAGMSTVSELLYFGKPTLFIPLPISQNNEQMENALFFKNQGLGEVFPQKTLSGERLYEHIVSMVTHHERYLKNAPKAKTLIQPDAASHILAVCEKAML